MRFGLLTQYYPPELGAPQARLSELAARLVARGHEVVVLTAMPNYPGGEIYPGYGGLVRWEEQTGVRILRSFIYPSQSLGLVKRMASYLSFVSSSLVAGSLLLPRLDFLMTESPPLFLGISGFLLSRLKGARWIFNVSDLWPESAVRLGVVGEGRALRLAQRLEAFCYQKAWLVTGQSRGIVEDIRRRFPAVPTYHLSNGVDTQLFRPDLEVGEGRCGLGEPGECIALYAGLHGLAQGLEQLLEAAARLRDLERFRIVLVGDGPEKRRLVQRARELELANVRFLDPRPREEMPRLLASADAAIACLKETLPGAVPSKIYEAMAAGRPLLLVAGGEPAEIVRGAGAGPIVDPGDVEGLARACRELAASPALRSGLGAAGRKLAESDYDRRRILDAFLDHLGRPTAESAPGTKLE